MLFNIVTLFPEFFHSPLQTALMAKATASGLVQFAMHNPREHGHGLHRSVDDRPYGGGPGMVLMLEPLLKSLRNIKEAGRILVMSPAGKPFTQSMAKDLAKEPSLTLVCGRYEGFDARLQDILPIEYINFGDAVLNGGEVPALGIIEAVSRLIPGFMGKEASGTEESFSTGLLEYPHYTRPEEFEGHKVPEVLLSGNHAHIETWRREKALEITLRQRSELLGEAPLTQQDAAYMQKLPRTNLGRNLHMALVHHPVIIEGKNSGTSSLTNLDIHDISRLSRTYGLGAYYIVTPLQDQQEVLKGILQHWVHGAAKYSHSDRAKALRLVHGVDGIADAIAHVQESTGQRPLIWASSAQWDGAGMAKKILMPPYISYAKAREILCTESVLLLLGTGHGLAPEVIEQCDAILPPLRYLSDYNHLSVRSAASIMVDRILGDIF